MNLNNYDGKSNKRFKLFINRPFQVSFLIYTSLSTVILTFSFLAANHFFFEKFMKQGEALSIPPNHLYFKFLEQQKATMNSIFIVTALVILLVNVIYGMYMSNRIAGPLYRLQKYPEEDLDRNSMSPLKFRKNELLSRVARGGK